MAAHSRRDSVPALVSPSSEALSSSTQAPYRTPAVPGWTLPLPDDRWSQIASECGLTQRETEIVRSVLDNLDTNDIATRLAIAPRTVRAHLEHVYRKLRLRTRCDLILLVFAASLDGLH